VNEFRIRNQFTRDRRGGTYSLALRGPSAREDQPKGAHLGRSAGRAAHTVPTHVADAVEAAAPRSRRPSAPSTSGSTTPWPPSTAGWWTWAQRGAGRRRPRRRHPGPVRRRGHGVTTTEFLRRLPRTALGLAGGVVASLGDRVRQARTHLGSTSW